jgi:sugar O-acyltransferase (sialic acid O-acetyltransferase NeuD family)
MKDLIIIGAGNVGAFLAYNLDLFEGSYKLLGFLDDDYQKNGKQIAGYPVLGKIDTIAQYPAGTAVAVGIAAPLTRKRIVEGIIHLPFEFPNFIARNAWLSNNVSTGKGVIIYPGVSINYESVLGDFVIMNMNCAIGHNATIGNYCTLAPGVNFGGFTTLDECVEVGIGAATKQSIHIGRNSIIGGQAMVKIRDHPRCPKGIRGTCAELVEVSAF